MASWAYYELMDDGLLGTCRRQIPISEYPTINLSNHSDRNTLIGFIDIARRAGK